MKRTFVKRFMMDRYGLNTVYIFNGSQNKPKTREK